LTEDNIYLILSGERNGKQLTGAFTVKIGKKLFAKYFQPEQTAKDVQAIVEQALEMYFSRK
jgi:hypothetical protein